MLPYPVCSNTTQRYALHLLQYDWLRTTPLPISRQPNSLSGLVCPHLGHSLVGSLPLYPFELTIAI